MKMIWKYGFVLLAGLALTLACSKENDPTDSGENTNPTEQPGEQPQMVTITVSMPEEGLTKIAFEQDPENKDGAVKLTWEEGDKILVNGEEFTLVSGAGTQTAGFSGPEVTAESYTIAYNGGAFGATQHQAADADTDHLAYIVSLTGVNTYQDVEFTQAWATANGGGTLTQSSIFRLRAQMPAGVAEDVVAVKILARDADDAPVNIFGGGNELTVMIDEAGDADEDGILDIYANLPTTAAAIPAGTAFFVRFMTTARGSAYSYTRYHVFSSALELTPGKVNALKLNCTATDKHAGLKSYCDGTTAAKAYLIGDAYQMKAVDGLMVAGETKYFKLIDDIDMNGAGTWTMLNNPSPYDKLIDFNGNHKTVSNLGGTMFYVFKGSVNDLTLDGSTVSGGNQKGVFAQYVQGSGHSITNVDLKNVASFEGSSGNGGALVGRINSGTAGAVSVTITECDVENVPVTCATVGGLIGRIDNKVIVSNCSYSGNTVKGTNQSVGGLVGLIGAENLDCSFTGCRVENATIDATGIVANSRAGGLIGWLRTGTTVKGCQVGTPESPVLVKTAAKKANETTGDKTKYYLESGGFVGYMQGGTITKDASGNHCKAYVTVSSDNTLGEPLRLGGFVGYMIAGTIEYSDVVSTMLHKNDGSGTLEGQHIGGFAGSVYGESLTLDHCTVKTEVYGNNWTAGFVGVGYAGTISNCEVLSGSTVNGQSGVGGFVGESRDGSNWQNNATAATVTIRGTNGGGFVGNCTGGSFSNNGATGSVTSSGNNYGGFIGNFNAAATFTRCFAEGNVSREEGKTPISAGGFVGNINNAGAKEISECYATGIINPGGEGAGGFIGKIEGSQTDNVSIHDCYATGTINLNTRRSGGFVGYITKTGGIVSFNNCYVTGAIKGTGYEHGGFAGRVDVKNVTIEHCAAWNSYVHGASAINNWSTGAVVGVAFPLCTLTDCYRKPNFSVDGYWGSEDMTHTWLLTNDQQHRNVSSSQPLMTMNTSGVLVETTKTTLSTSGDAQFAYQGKCDVSKTLSQLASTTLGWSSDVWDFTGDLPTLK